MPLVEVSSCRRQVDLRFQRQNEYRHSQKKNPNRLKNDEMNTSLHVIGSIIVCFKEKLVD